jgi:tRNA(Ser,Leu) C12 N-acetylase TAN1
MRSFFRWIRDSLFGPAQTPLNTVADQETVEEILSRMATMQRQIATLQYEWSETLDKLTVQASRFSARVKKRAQREFDELDQDEGGGREVRQAVSPERDDPVPAAPLTKLQIIQKQIQARRAGGL